MPIKDDLKSNKRAVYVILGIDAQGFKEILGIWIDGNESASFWSSVFEDLKERGVEDILYMSSDGIAGFKGSLERVFPKAQSQRCVVHLVRNLYGICPKKEAKEVIADFKRIYTSTTFDEANIRLDEFKERWKDNKKFPNENSVYKVMFLRINELSQKWTRPIPNWKTIQPQLIELFGDRYTQYIEV